MNDYIEKYFKLYRESSVFLSHKCKTYLVFSHPSYYLPLDSCNLKKWNILRTCLKLKTMQFYHCFDWLDFRYFGMSINKWYGAEKSKVSYMCNFVKIMEA